MTKKLYGLWVKGHGQTNSILVVWLVTQISLICFDVCGSYFANYGLRCEGDKNISRLHLSCRISDLQFSLVLQTQALVL